MQSFRSTGKMPELKTNGRPQKLLDPEQINTINQVFNDTKLSPRLLYFELKRRGNKIAKNKLYQYLKQRGFVIPNPQSAEETQTMQIRKTTQRFSAAWRQPSHVCKSSLLHVVDG